MVGEGMVGPARLRLVGLRWRERPSATVRAARAARATRGRASFGAARVHGAQEQMRACGVFSAATCSAAVARLHGDVPVPMPVPEPLPELEPVLWAGAWGCGRVLMGIGIFAPPCCGRDARG